MSANVENMLYVKGHEVPWHGLGTTIDEKDRYSVERGLELSGTDWQVELCPLYTHDEADGETVYGTVAEHGQAVRRVTDKKILGVVGPSYTPLQNKDAFEWFRPMFDEKICAINTAGSLCEGAKVWVLANIVGARPMEIVKNDLVERFLLLSNSHDGTSAVRVGLTPIRVVCTNTLAMAHGNKQSSFIKLKHRTNVKAKLDEVRDMINFANKKFEESAEKYRFLATKRVNETNLMTLVKTMCGVDLEKPSGEIPTRTQNKMTKLINLMVNGRGNDQSQVRGTYWAAYNGITEWLNWEQGRTVNNRMDSLWFGKGIADSEKALKMCLEFATAA